MTRIVVHAPHFAEYATRLAAAFPADCRVLLLVDRRNFAMELDSDYAKGLPPNLKVVQFDSVGRWTRLKSLVRICFHVAAFRTHLIVQQEQIDALTAWVSRLLARVYPTLLTIHDPVPHTGNDSAFALRNAYNKAAIRRLARAFHVHGPYCLSQLRLHVDATRPALETTHGVILTPGSADFRTPEAGRILMFGRMETYKGLQVLLDAARILAQKGLAHSLVIAGRGPELQRLRPEFEKLDAVEIIDTFLSPAEACQQFQRSSMVVAPYLNATQSGVVAAAFGNGRPVIASKTGGLADVVVDGVNGMFVTPGSAEELANAISTLITDTEKLGILTENAAETGRTRHNWEVISGQIVEFASNTLR